MALVISTTFAMSFPEMSIDGVSVCVPVSMYVSLLPSYVLIKPLLIHALTLPLSHTQVPIEGLAHRGPDAFVAIIWVYCIVIFFLQDAAKVGTFALLRNRCWLGMEHSDNTVLSDSSLCSHEEEWNTSFQRSDSSGRTHERSQRERATETERQRKRESERHRQARATEEKVELTEEPKGSRRLSSKQPPSGTLCPCYHDCSCCASFAPLAAPPPPQRHLPHCQMHACLGAWRDPLAGSLHRCLCCFHWCCWRC